VSTATTELLLTLLRLLTMTTRLSATSLLHSLPSSSPLSPLFSLVRPRCLSLAARPPTRPEGEDHPPTPCYLLPSSRSSLPQNIGVFQVCVRAVDIAMIRLGAEPSQTNSKREVRTDQTRTAGTAMADGHICTTTSKREICPTHLVSLPYLLPRAWRQAGPSQNRKTGCVHTFSWPDRL